MNYKPIGSRLVVKPLKEETVKQGSIIIPGTTSAGYKQGEVVAVGIGHYENGVLVPSEVKVGDKILFVEHGGVEVGNGDSKYNVILESNVIVVIN